MFCPKCGTAISEKLNYCRSCGFRLSTITQLVENDGQPVEDPNAKPLDSLQLNRKDLNLGAGLMYFGTLLALFVGVFFGGAHSQDGLDAMFALPLAIIWYLLTNAAVFGALLLGLRFSSRQKDMSLGATLMFILSLLSSFVVAVPALGIEVDTVEMYGKAELVALTLSFVTALFFGQPLLQRLLRGLFNLFAAEATTRETSRTMVGTEKTALPPAQSEPVETFVKREAEPYKIVSSVTEEPTRRLEHEKKPLSH
ncbi:MAG TPA: zinc ribbon domain-containing protein [Blastocatellia bacterium]|nr:zinc ribbon domain-containing protein [Blastocatellia bacterium]